MPHCDLRTGEIFGCEEGSLAWWHEKGHFEYNKHPQLSKASLWADYLFYFWMMSLTALVISNHAKPLLDTILKFSSFIPVMLIVYLWFYEEVWVHNWAHKKIKEMEEKNEGGDLLQGEHSRPDNS